LRNCDLLDEKKRSCEREVQERNAVGLGICGQIVDVALDVRLAGEFADAWHVLFVSVVISGCSIYLVVVRRVVERVAEVHVTAVERDRSLS